jgi:hypothetical protein
MEDLGVDGRIGYGLDTSGSEQRSVAGSYEQGKGNSGSIEGRDFLDQLRGY